MGVQACIRKSCQSFPHAPGNGGGQTCVFAPTITLLSRKRSMLMVLVDLLDERISVASMRNASGYVAYLLRLWRRGQGKETVWQAFLEDPHTGERHGFRDLESLCAFLGEQTAPINPDEEES